MSKETGPKQPGDRQGQEDPKLISRREFLGKAAGVASALLFSQVGVDAYMKYDTQKRSAELKKAAQFLLGASKERMNFLGKELNYQEFCSLVRDVVDPPIQKHAELAALLDSFVYMMEVEDTFAGHLNVWKGLEDAEFFREKHLQKHLDKVGISKEKAVLADSFGFGQIQPATAVMLVMDKESKFRESGTVNEKQLARLKEKDVPFYEISEILGLQSGGNLLLSFLYFYECSNLFSRSTGGAIHGGLEFPDQRGQLQPLRYVNPRGFSLAISAYSAGLEAPMVAKAQTYLDELLLLNSDFAKRMGDTKKLVIDGDIGPMCLQAFQRSAEILGFQAPKDLALKPKTMEEQRRLLKALDTWLSGVQSAWRGSMDGFFNSHDVKEPALLRSLAESRYSLQIKNYLLLKKFMPDEKARQMFFDFMDQRGGDFLNGLDDAEIFQNSTGSRDHDKYVKSFQRMVREHIDFDERFKGYVPTHFQLASLPGADPLNIPARVILAFDLDEKSRSRIK